VIVGQAAPLDDGAGPAPSEGDEPIDWEACGESLECGRLTVPLDHDDPAGATIEIALTRFLARDAGERIGSLLVNPGGPGTGGLFLAEFADRLYGDRLLDRFDIVAFDPRGVGASTPAVDCADDLDPYFSLDSTPDDDAEREAVALASEDFVSGCVERSGLELLAHVSTREAATDLDLIRQALGEDEISYFGFSYGSELGAAWVTLFPETVRAAVLDSAAAPNPDGVDQAVEDTVALEAALGRFFADCAEDPSCALNDGGSPEAAYTDLMEGLELEPLEVDPDRPPVNEGIAFVAVISALYDALSWPDLARALDDARSGDGAALLGMYDAYLLRAPDGSYGNDFDALLAINCLDDQSPRDRSFTDSVNAEIAQAAPILGRHVILAYVCSDWPVPSAPDLQITGAGAGPVVVIGSTGDPITSIESSRKMADALEGGVFVSVAAEQHIAYGVSACGNDIIEDYLIDLTVPADGTECD
jgi:pimeloyl-ACP methyl ester carboxylesterase